LEHYTAVVTSIVEQLERRPRNTYLAPHTMNHAWAFKLRRNISYTELSSAPEPNIFLNRIADAVQNKYYSCTVMIVLQ
jgi:hypothetical protein